MRGREKHLYSIYRKMSEKRLSFSQVLDIYGFRVVVPDIQTCYRALGALHGLYKPVPGKFKDYVAIPKGNGYQSLHTTLIGPFGTPVEVQIRTPEMNHVAETGVASHWLYKEDEKTLTDLQHKTHSWLQSLLELQSTSGDSSEFLEHVKIDLFPGEVYAFTPKGKIFALPRGATVVDFAYAVHTDVGNRCVAGRINGELMPLRTELHNGDQIEIITAAHASPNPAWLSYVRTGKARAQIRHFLKNAQQEEASTLGERLLNQACFGQELADTAFDHVLNNVFWLAFDFFFVQLQEHSFFTLDRFGRNFRRQQELRVACSNVHRDVFGQLNVAAFQNNCNTDFVAVQVATNYVTFNANQATDVDVFANRADQYQASCFLSFDQRLNSGQLVSESFFDAGSNECLEVILQSQEVGLGVHFQQNGGFAVFFQSDSAFSSHVTCFLGSLDGAGSTHVINGFFDVAAGLGQGLFAIHHAFAGTLTQFFNQRCSNLCHFKILLDRFSTIPPD
mgnify:CR=1 FL=1